MEMDINQQEVSLPSSSQSADDDVSTGFNRLKPQGSVNQSAYDDVSFGDDDNSNNQQLKPDGFVNPLADDDDVSTGFNRLKPEGSVDQYADDDVSTGFDSLKPEGSVNQSADDDVSTGFTVLKPEDSVNQSADDDVSTGFNSLRPEYSVNQWEAADVATGYNQSQELKLESPETDVEDEEDDVSTGFNHLKKPDDSVDQSANDDVSFNHDSVAQSAADDVSCVDDSVSQSAADDDVISGDNNSQHIKPDDSGDQAKPDDVSFGFNNIQINANDDNIEDEDDDVEGDFTFACVGDETDSFNGYETGEIRTVYPLFDQSLLSGGGGDYCEGKLKLPVNVPVNKIYIESPSNNGEASGTVYALSDGMGSGSPEMKMKSNSTGFSKLWRFRKEMNRSNSDSRDAFVFFENSNRAGKSTEKVNINGRSTGKVNVTGRSTEKVNVTGGKGKAVRKDLGSKKVVASAHEVYLKQKAGQPEEERRRSYLPYRPGLMGFFTNVNGGLSKNVHPF